MTEPELRTSIRALLASGELPQTLPPASQIVPGQLNRTTEISVGRPRRRHARPAESRDRW